jgi:hypothetical protein
MSAYALIAAQGRADPASRPDRRSHAGDASSGRTAPPIFQSVRFRQGQLSRPLPPRGKLRGQDSKGYKPTPGRLDGVIGQTVFSPGAVLDYASKVGTPNPYMLDGNSGHGIAGPARFGPTPPRPFLEPGNSSAPPPLSALSALMPFGSRPAY